MKIMCVKKEFFYSLWVFFIGYMPLAVKAQQTDTLDLGYKKVAVADFNGSAYTISAHELRNLPVTNLTNLLSGLVPGFFSIQTSGGTVNEAADYWIRGIRTNAEGVLVLVDGQERQFGVLSSNEVESITVLKDASMSALYGTRAANGIVFVSTKKGKKGRPTVELTSQMINQQPLGMLESVDALTYAQHYNEALKYDGLDASQMYSQNYLDQYRNRSGINEELYPDINWREQYFKKTNWVQRHNLSISGGSDRTRYFINGGFLKQAGMFVTDEESAYSTNNTTSRYNLRSNLEVDVTKTTLLNLDLYGWFDKQNRPGGDSYGAYNALVTTPPNAFPAYYMDNGQYTDQDGNIVRGINNRITAGNDLTSNPWALLNRNGYSILNRVYGSFRAKLTQELSFLTEGLTASAMLSMDSYTAAVTNREKGFAYYNLSDINSTVLRRTGTDQQMNNGITDRASEARNSLDLQIAYEKKLNNHYLSATAFYNQYEFDNQTSIPSRFQTIGSWLGYNYKHIYYIDLTGSYHGVYKFAPGKRFGFFPVLTAGWNISNESFFEPAKDVISYLKFRGSYGLIGNQRGVSEFQYRTRLNEVGGVYWFGNAMNARPGFVEDILANPNLTWEKARQLNLGADIRLFNDRFSYSFDYFKDKRSDMYMVNNNVTSLLGSIATIQQNIGEMFSEGYEMAAYWKSTIGDFAYRIGGTYSFAKNENVKTGEIQEPYPWLQDAGYARGVRRGYVATGLFQSAEEIAASPRQTFSEVQPGDIKYKDINGDGLIDRNDQVPIGYGNVPGIFYGFNGSISYKGISLMALFQGAGHTTQMLGGKVAYPFLANGTIYEHQLDYWTPENRSASLPNISTVNDNVNNTQTSSFWLKDGSYLRLKTIELSYQFPQKMLGNSFVKNLILFANGYNMYVWPKDDSPLDPEDNGGANSMPLTRNVSFGLSIRF
ncbi:TonB-dependent receptor [Niabella insulamsoli]|uniref:SusC/RagA family TonB-linked outer membrane protein n=1 Tax=Niabella insulamsoli TaxID=3144874 RepID=UPI0031FC9B62